MSFFRIDKPVSVTPNDSSTTNALVSGCPADRFWVGVSGDVAVLYEDGSTFIYKAVTAGGWHPAFGFIAVLATGTNATSISVSRRVP